MSARSATKDSKAKNRKRLVLLDSHAILHRAYHAIPDFATSKGEPTGALYGLITTLLKAIYDFQPDYIIAARDLPGPTFRDKMFEAYKGTRAEIDPPLIEQLKKAPEILKAFGIPVYSAEGFEADDVIGTIAENVRKDVDVIIATGDADMFQLVDGEKVQVYHLRQGINDLVLYDDERVRERYGFGPEHVIDYKGIRGDASDNIPGVPGVGEGSATKLIETFGALEDIYAAIEKKGVEKVAKEAGVQKRYAQLVADNKEKALFSRELATISRKAPIDFSLPEKDWSVLDHMSAIDEVCDTYEFRSIKERLHSKLKTLEAADSVAEEENEEEVDPKILRETAIMLWLLNSEMAEPTLQQILDYMQTKKFSGAREGIVKKMRETGRLREVFENIEKPLIPVVEEMNARGVCIDTKALQALVKEYSKELGVIAGRIYKYAGHEFNISSPKQLAVVLFDELKITPEKQKKTSTGQRTTKEEELAKMSDQHPIIEDVLQFRELQKLLSTYVEKILELVGKDGRLRAEFLQSSTVTGRMGCQNPNLQNIPIRTEYGRRIRSAFNAPKGKCLISLDYSQIELRVAAGLSGDQKLIDVFKKGSDIHTAVAANVFSVPLEHVDKEMRRRAKVINFGILYGMGANALRQNLGGNVTRDEAANYLHEYFAQYPDLSNWVEKTKREAERQGFVETVFGRRRYLPGFKSALPMMRAQAERFAVNAPIQGSQADIIKLAMVKADEMIKEKKWEDKVKLVLQIHDELVYEVDESVAEKAAKEIREVMQNVAPEKELAGVPIVAEAAVGEDWGEMRKLGASQGRSG
ncbi:MAG: DNA polymerase [Minisyncoccia bacterium]